MQEFFENAQPRVVAMMLGGILLLARLWDVVGDLDFPRAEWPLAIRALTQTELNRDTGGLEILDRDSWLAERELYLEVAREHHAGCRFPSASLYLRFFPEEAREPGSLD